MQLILSIDPGQHNLGYAVSKLKDNGDICVIEYGTYHPYESWYKNPDIRPYKKYLNNRTLNGREISVFIKRIVEEYNPNYIVSEDAFYNPRRPQAYASLLICIYAVESTLYSILRADNEKDVSECRLYKIPPKSIKRVVSMDAGGNATKGDMLESLKSLIKERKIEFMGYPVRSGPELSDLTEHEIDSIGIGHTFTRIWLPIIHGKVLDSNITALNATTKKQLKKKGYKCRYLY